MHRIFYYPEYDDPLTAGARALRYSNFHGCFFAQSGDLQRAGQHLALGSDQVTIFHLTDENGIFADATDAKRARDLCQRFLNALDVFITSGGRFIWSVESDAPHGLLPPEQAAEMRASLGRLAHLVHCSCFATAKAIQTDMDLDWRKISVVPSGNFLPLIDQRAQTTWPPINTKPPRERLNLDERKRLVVHFGNASPASGTDRLLAYWREAQPTDAALLLLGPLARAIPRDKEASLRANGIHLRTDANSVAELAVWVTAADVVILPFEHFVGTAELMLALTCGRPSLIPALPSLLELVTPEREAFVYHPSKGKNAFVDIINHTLDVDKDQLLAMGKHAEERATAMPWRMLGRQFADSFLRVAAGGFQGLSLLNLRQQS